MNFAAQFIHAMKTALRPGGTAGHMITVVRESLAGREARRFADDAVAFNHELLAVRVKDDPFAAQEGDRAIGAVGDRDKIDECMGFVRRQTRSSMVITELVEGGG